MSACAVLVAAEPPSAKYSTELDDRTSRRNLDLAGLAAHHAAADSSGVSASIAVAAVAGDTTLHAVACRMMTTSGT